MSTKTSIKSRVCADEQPGFHLYDDLLDNIGVAGGAPESPVYLRLVGAAVQLETPNSGGATVTVAVPRDMARELSLLPLEDGRRPTRNI